MTNSGSSLPLDASQDEVYCLALRQIPRQSSNAEGVLVMKNNTLIAALFVGLLALPLASAASAQVTTATIVGTITDSSGGALPGATVTARNAETGFNRTVPANEVGAYRLEFLPIGSYVVEVTLSGFKTANRSGIVLNVNDTARVDVSLSLGGVTETVTVEAAPRCQHDHRRHLEDDRRHGDPEPADRRSQRLLAAGPDARRAVQQQRRRLRVRDDQLAEPRLPRAAHADQRRRRRRHRLGELLPRRRHQHDRAAQHRQHPAQPGRHPGVQGPDQQLQRGVRALRRAASSTSSPRPAPTTTGARPSSTCATRR